MARLQRRARRGRAWHLRQRHSPASLDAIQRAFGSHDVSGVQAHTDAAASDGSRAMGAEAFATADHIAFDGAPSLHTAAHEAAHVVQQRAGVHLKGGVGESGDSYERHADAVADRVVAGDSAQDLLDQHAPGARAAGVQRHAIQRQVPRRRPPRARVVPPGRSIACAPRSRRRTPPTCARRTLRCSRPTRSPSRPTSRCSRR